MPDNDLLRRYLDAGVAFTQLTRQRAESIVRDLVRSGEVSRDQATARVEELLERSRQNTEGVLSLVRKELDDRIAQLNLVTRDDVTNLLSRLGISAGTVRRARASGRRVAKKATSGAKATARKTTAKKTAAKKSAAKKATTAKKATAKKATTAKKTAARKTTAAKKATAKKATTAKKTVARKATAAKKSTAPATGGSAA